MAPAVAKTSTVAVRDSIIIVALFAAEMAGWLFPVVGTGALLTAAGAVIAITDPALLLGPHDRVTDAVRVYAAYLFSRNLALAVVLVVALAARARRVLAALLLLTALVQLLDAAVDATTGRWVLVPGLVVLVGGFLLGADRLYDRRMWKVNIWGDRPHLGQQPQNDGTRQPSN
jgi:hypothetical protein